MYEPEPGPWVPAPEGSEASEGIPEDVRAETAAALAAAGEVTAPEPEGPEASEAPEPEEPETPEQVEPVEPKPAAPIAAPSPVPSTAPSTPGPTEQQISRYLARAEAMAELGRRQQALDLLNELIVSGADDVRIWRSLATVHLEAGDGEKALRAADWVVTFDPSDEWGYRLRSSALQLLQRPEEAVQAASQAVKLGPDVWQGQAALALALHSTGDLSAAVAAARKATQIATELSPALAPEAQQVEDAVQAAADAAEGAEPALNEEIALIQGLEAAINGSPDGLDDESLQHVSNLVLRALEFSAGAGWLVSFGGVAIPNINFRLLIPVAVLVVLAAFLFGPARKAGRELWRYLFAYLWQDPKTRTALLLAVGAHVWMIAGSSVGHVQGGSALGIGLLTHLTGRTVLAKKAPELNPVKRVPGKAEAKPDAGMTGAVA